MGRQETINRFLAVSYLYFRLTDKSCEEPPPVDLEELLEIVNAGNEPIPGPDQHIA
jgi:hypothetical protein